MKRRNRIEPDKSGARISAATKSTDQQFSSISQENRRQVPWIPASPTTTQRSAASPRKRSARSRRTKLAWLCQLWFGSKCVLARRLSFSGCGLIRLIALQLARLADVKKDAHKLEGVLLALASLAEATAALSDLDARRNLQAQVRCTSIFQAL